MSKRKQLGASYNAADVFLDFFDEQEKEPVVLTPDVLAYRAYVEMMPLTTFTIGKAKTEYVIFQGKNGSISKNVFIMGKSLQKAYEVLPVGDSPFTVAAYEILGGGATRAQEPYAPPGAPKVTGQAVAGYATTPGGKSRGTYIKV